MRSAGARSSRREPRRRRRRSGPCRRSSTARCARIARSHSAPRRALPAGGTISPEANASIRNLPLVAAAQRLAMTSAAPKSVSRLFGKLDASRHLTSGCAPCPSAGAAAVPAARLTAVLVRNERRCIGPIPPMAERIPGRAASARTGHVPMRKPQRRVILTEAWRRSSAPRRRACGPR